MKNVWWKVLAVLLIGYALSAGLLIGIPNLAMNSILEETIRNLFYHVPMWFGMNILMIVSVIYAIRYLKNGQEKDDFASVEFANVAVLFGILGALTGSFWARFTWGQFWPNDAKLNGAGIGLLIYLAYLILRSGIEEPNKRARVSAVYNVFAFPVFVVLIWILPRLNDSLHPGNGGNPGFSSYDIDQNMRMVFYPAVAGWTLMGVWYASLKIRLRKIESAENV